MLGENIKSFTVRSFWQIVNYVRNNVISPFTTYIQTLEVGASSPELPVELWMFIFSLVSPTEKQLLPSQIRGVSRGWLTTYDALLRRQRTQAQLSLPIRPGAIKYEVILAPSAKFNPQLGCIYLVKNKQGQFIYLFRTSQYGVIKGNLELTSDPSISFQQDEEIKREIETKLKDLIDPILGVENANQLAEIAYLLRQKEVIFKKIVLSETLLSYFSHLEQAYTQSGNKSDFYYVLGEKLLDKINFEIVQHTILLTVTARKNNDTTVHANRNILDCENCHLTRLPAALFTYKENTNFWATLQNFYLNNNALRSLPPEIGRLLALEFCNLSNNRIEKLPAEIQHLQTLKLLDLSFNSLQNLPSAIGLLPSLQVLLVEKNYLQALPETLKEDILASCDRTGLYWSSSKKAILAKQRLLPPSIEQTVSNFPKKRHIK